LPKWKSNPVTTWRMPRFVDQDVRRTNASASKRREIARSNGCSITALKPSACSRRARTGAGVSLIERHVGPEDRARGCGSKVSDERRHAARIGFGKRTLENRLVTAVHAIEIADRDDASPRPLRAVPTSRQCARSASPSCGYARTRDDGDRAVSVLVEKGCQALCGSGACAATILGGMDTRRDEEHVETVARMRL
jgi:hypothetical protein